MDRSCTWRQRRTWGKFEDYGNKKIKQQNQRSKDITEGHYFLGPSNGGTLRLADYVTPRRTHTYKALYFLCNVFCVPYLRGHCKKAVMTKCSCKSSRRTSNIYFGDLSHLITTILVLKAQQQQQVHHPGWTNKTESVSTKDFKKVSLCCCLKLDDL